MSVLSLTPTKGYVKARCGIKNVGSRQGLVVQDCVAEVNRQGAAKPQGLWHIRRSRRTRSGATQ